MFDIFPRDESALFDAPTIINVTTVAAKAIQFVPADPDRVVLILAGTQLNPVKVGPAAPAGQTNGLILNAPNVFFLTVRDYGALVASEWYVFDQPGGNVVTAVTMTMRRPPAMSGYTDLFHAPMGSGASSALPPALPTSPVTRPARAPTTALVRQLLRQRCPSLFPYGG